MDIFFVEQVATRKNRGLCEVAFYAAWVFLVAAAPGRAVRPDEYLCQYGWRHRHDFPVGAS